MQRVGDAGRRLGTASVIFHQAVAERVGLSGADHKYLDLLVQNGAMTAGHLAELTGLTTGAITGVIDRLERSGLVRREKDPADRRKVIVVPNEDEAYRLIGPVFLAMQDDFERLYEGYSDQQMAVILDYLEQSSKFLLEKAQGLRAGISGQGEVEKERP